MFDANAQKKALREEIRARCAALGDREARSARIAAACRGLPEVQAASMVWLYVGVRHEVATNALVTALLAEGKSVVVPWCEGDELQPFLLRDPAELAAGRFGVPAPPAALRGDLTRRPALSAIDLVIVPGLGFDRQGHRLGQGRGYYDRLLARLPRRVSRIGLGFACQVVDAVPHEPHDEPLDGLVTEVEVIWFGESR